MDERTMMGVMLWRKRMKADMDVFAMAVENDDVELAVCCLLDMQVIVSMKPAEGGGLLCMSLFGDRRTAEAILGGREAQNEKWLEAMVRAGWDFAVEQAGVMNGR